MNEEDRNVLIGFILVCFAAFLFFSLFFDAVKVAIAVFAIFIGVIGLGTMVYPTEDKEKKKNK